MSILYVSKCLRSRTVALLGKNHSVLLVSACAMFCVRIHLLLPAILNSTLPKLYLTLTINFITQVADLLQLNSELNSIYYLALHVDSKNDDAIEKILTKLENTLVQISN